MRPAPEITLTKTARGYSLPKSEHHFDRAAICRRAHQIKAERREELARRTFAAEARVVAGRPHHDRTFAQVLKATPADFSAAMRASWAEAKRANDQHSRKNALTVTTGAGALATIGARLRTIDLITLLSSVASFVESRFMPSRFN